MIISHRHRFIFIKTHKTAGSSIETLLSRYCGPDDIVTTMDPPAPGHEPRNWIGNAPLDYWYAHSRRARKLIHRDSRWLRQHYYQHMGAQRIRYLCGDAVWNSYYKFCFDRNPWDKVVSFYWWKMRGKSEQVPFSHWLREKQLPVDAALYSLDGEPAVSFVGRYENLAVDLSTVLGHIGLPWDGHLPEVKTTVRRERDKRPEEFYNAADRDLVARRFARELDLLGYRFGRDCRGEPPVVFSP